MVQVTSSGWNSVVNSPYRPLTTGVFVSWNKTLASGINYFTVNTSLIGGIDIIRGGGGTNVSFFDKYLYNDNTAQAKNWSVNRDIGQFPFGLIMAQADVELDNNSRMFLPNVDTTIGSGILPGRPLKLSVGMNQDSLSQFVGFAGQPEISITQRNLKLHAFDVMDYINNYTFSTVSGTTFSGILSNTTTASAISYYLGLLGFNANQMKLDTPLGGTLYYVNVTDRKFGQVLQDMMAAEQGILFADENGIINFWNRQHFNTISGIGSQFNISYGNAISIDYSNAPIINDVIVNANPRNITSQAQVVWSLTQSMDVIPGIVSTIFANFTDNNGALPVTNLIDPTYSALPVGTSYYTVTSPILSSPQSYITVTSTYLFGSSYKITFSNSSNSTITISDMVLYGLPAKVTSFISEHYFDQASIDAYGRNPSNNGDSLQIQSDYIQDSTTARGLGYDLVSRYGSPNRHYDVEIFSNPALQIGDFGTLDPDGSGSKKSVWITGKTDKLNPGGALTQLLKLEERVIYNYFTINVSVIGGTDRLAT